MRRIFVGNIPYSYNESDIQKILSLVGPVKAFRIQEDAKRNSKGYGFCDYSSEETALSALRNLNKMEYNGRLLRIGPENNKTDLLSEEENIMQKDITYIRELDNVENSKTNSNSKNDFQNLLLGLSEEQKILLLYTMKTLYGNDSNKFKQLLENQNEETLNAVLAIQNDVINAYRNNNIK